MKKTLFWVIACIYFIVYVWLMKTLSLWGSTYIVFFAFMAFIPLIPFLAPSADDGEEKTKRHEGCNISNHIDKKKQGADGTVISEVSGNFLKGHQIILVPPAGIRAPETL